MFANLKQFLEVHVNGEYKMNFSYINISKIFYFYTVNINIRNK